MKKGLLILAAGLLLLLCNCSNQKIKSLESENSQLIEKIDSLTIRLHEASELRKLAEKRADSTDIRFLRLQIELDKCQQSNQNNK